MSAIILTRITPDVSLTISNGPTRLLSTTQLATNSNTVDGLLGCLAVQGDLLLYNDTKNNIAFNPVGLGVPTFTNRSVGTKITLYPSISANTADHALGIETGFAWRSVPDSTFGYKWYAGTSNLMTLAGTGNLTVPGQIISSTQLVSNAGTSFHQYFNSSGGQVRASISLKNTIVTNGGQDYSISRWDDSSIETLSLDIKRLTGDLTVYSTSDATSSSAGGSLTLSGGCAVAKKLYVGTTLNVSGLGTFSGGLTSTAGTTTLGASTIGAITGTTATFSSTIDVTGIPTFRTYSRFYSDAGSSPQINLYNNTPQERWNIYTAATETGSDTGSNLFIRSKLDSGANGTVTQVARATGRWTMPGGITSSSTITLTNSGGTTTLGTLASKRSYIQCTDGTDIQLAPAKTLRLGALTTGAVSGGIFDEACPEYYNESAGDGSTECSAAILKAIQFAIVNNVPMKLKNGNVYMITSSVIVTLPANGSLIIEGNGGQIQWNTSVTVLWITPMIKIISPDQGNERNTSFTANNVIMDATGFGTAYNTEYNIHGFYTTTAIISINNCIFQNIFGIGISTYYAYKRSIVNTHFYLVGGNDFENHDRHGDSIFCSDTQENGTTFISGCTMIGMGSTVTDMGRIGITFEQYNGAFAHKALIENCYIKNYQRAFHNEEREQTSFDCTFIGCIFDTYVGGIIFFCGGRMTLDNCTWTNQLTGYIGVVGSSATSCGPIISSLAWPDRIIYVNNCLINVDQSMTGTTSSLSASTLYVSNSTLDYHNNYWILANCPECHFSNVHFLNIGTTFNHSLCTVTYDECTFSAYGTYGTAFNTGSNDSIRSVKNCTFLNCSIVYLGNTVPMDLANNLFIKDDTATGITQFISGAGTVHSRNNLFITGSSSASIGGTTSNGDIRIINGVVQPVAFNSGINVSLTTDSTSSSTGSITTLGGMGVAKNLVIGKGLVNTQALQTISADSNTTYTNSQIVPGAKLYRTSLSVARTDTLPTAALIVAGLTGAVVGSSYSFFVLNNGGNQLIINSGSGNNIPSITLNQGQTACYHLIITNISGGTESTFGAVSIT